MALDSSFIGRTYPPTTAYEVGARRSASSRTLSESRTRPTGTRTLPRALGHPDVIAPPTFAIILTLAAADQVTHDPELGLDYSRVVHGEQRFVYTRPVRARDRLATTIVVESIRSAAGNDMITTRADVATEDGEPVVSAYSTLVARGTAEAEAS